MFYMEPHLTTIKMSDCNCDTLSGQRVGLSCVIEFDNSGLIPVGDHRNDVNLAIMNELRDEAINLSRRWHYKRYTNSCGQFEHTTT